MFHYLKIEILKQFYFQRPLFFIIIKQALIAIRVRMINSVLHISHLMKF